MLLPPAPSRQGLTLAVSLDRRSLLLSRQTALLLWILIPFPLLILLGLRMVLVCFCYLSLYNKLPPNSKASTQHSLPPFLWVCNPSAAWVGPQALRSLRVSQLRCWLKLQFHLKARLGAGPLPSSLIRVVVGGIQFLEGC